MDRIKRETESFEIIMMIKEIYSLMNNHIGLGMKVSGLTNQQVMIIKILAHQKEITLTGLCKELSLTKATVSGIIKRLEEAGYIEKAKKESDRRSTYITLSDKGKTFAYSFKKDMDDSFCNVFQKLSIEELDQIKHALELLISKM